MKTYPLILTAADVRAVRNGMKTQHRVRVKPQPVGAVVGRRVLYSTHALDIDKFVFLDSEEGGTARVIARARCPFGVPGDRLWVREAFIYEPADYEWSASVSIPVRPATVVYRADCPDPRGAPWKSPVCMPQSLSRLTLAVESVRVQRVQEISDADAEAEGVLLWAENALGLQVLRAAGIAVPTRPRFLYRLMVGDDRWNANDWLFALTFKRAEGSR